MKNVKRLFDIPYYQQQNCPRKIALSSKINGKWISWSTDRFLTEANEVSRGLIALGIQPGDKIGLISNNRPEWHIMDIGILQIGAIDVPIYPTISEADYKFIFNDAGIKMCIVSDNELLKKVHAIKNEVDTLDAIYTFDEIAGATHWSVIKEKAHATEQHTVEERKDAIKAEDLATLIYTSGTTGVPKGVMLSHANITSNCLASFPRLPIDNKAIALSFLPICHIYERMMTYLYMLTGVSIYFAESMDTISDNLKEIKPTVFTAVPRLLEKVYDAIVAKGSELTGMKKKLFFMALEHGLKYREKNSSIYNYKLKIARKLIFSKWQEALGGNVKVIASGGAALQPRLARIFHAAGIPVMEGYGLTETSPVVAVNCADNDGVRFGSVGRVLEGVSVKIAKDGEILVKGPNVMLGYYNLPEATAEAIDQDGWFHTGDIGEFIDGDFLKITDRKKEIFKTSSGKYIAPQVLENKLKESRFIEQIMVIGENEKHPAALISPDFTSLKAYCETHNISYSDQKDLVGKEAVVHKIMEEVNQYNHLFGNWEQIKKIELTAITWSVETGELTPTLKLKRKFIMQKYAHLVRKIYAA